MLVRGTNKPHNNKNNMTKYTLYIGANNQTKVVEKDKLVSCISDMFDGFTMVDSVGYWKGAREESVVVTIFTEADRVVLVDLCVSLCTVLKQDCILLEVDGKGELI